MCAKIISIEQAVEMKNEYKAHIKPLIESYRGGNYKATEFAWIDIETLKEYINLLEEVNSKNEDQISGVRIYFGAHPKITTSDTKTAEMYSERESVFLVPTVELPSTATSAEYPNLNHVPFCINTNGGSDPNKGSFEAISDLLNAEDNSSTRTTDYSNKTSLVMNRMSLTPPPG